MTNAARLFPSLRANGSRERAPDDRLREAIHVKTEQGASWIASSRTLLAMTAFTVPSSVRFASQPFSNGGGRLSEGSVGSGF
jgi:hypothetical protein